MWGQVGCAGPWEPHPGRSSCQPRSAGDRKRRGNYTNTLRELAQMLPVPLHTSYKKLTKKEILLHVFRYIEHLQASISTATALLQLQSGEKEEFAVGASRHVEMSACQRGRGDGTPRRRRARLLNVGKKPRKGKRSRRSERRGVNREARRSLSLGQSPLQPGQLPEADLRVAGEALLSPGTKQLLFQFSCRDPALGSRRPTGSTFVDRAKGSVPGGAAGSHGRSIRNQGWSYCNTESPLRGNVASGGVGQKRVRAFADWCVGCDREESQEDDDICSACEARLIYQEQRWYDRSDQALLGQEWQELVQYHSCGEEEEDGPDASPWLSTQSPGCGSRESSLLCSPGSGGRIGACWASKDLGLSPSLFSSPGRLLPRHVLQWGPEELSQAGLFEDVCLSPQSAGSCDSLAGALQRKNSSHQTLPDAPLNSLNLFQSAFSLDHCYLSYTEASKTDSSPSLGVTELMAACGQLLQEGSSPKPDRSVSSSDENSDSTWMPYKRTKPPPAAPRKRKKGEGGRQPEASNKSRSPVQLKKKCVNGFIMFCRLNRKQYIRACPGMASTAATRELAQLWRNMTKQERRPYCVRARRFSRLNNRIVKQDFSSGAEEEEEMEAPKPFHLLLAEKSLGSGDLGPHSLQHPPPESA